MDSVEYITQYIVMMIYTQLEMCHSILIIQKIDNSKILRKDFILNKTPRIKNQSRTSFQKFNNYNLLWFLISH